MLVSLIMLSMLSNMDFQATLSKDAVLEYMTKYMTKSGQGSLIKVMEHSFALCIEKARENDQGTGSAVLRWFNLQSITEVKSQLECMHLIFGAPHHLCSREFRDLYLRAETRQPKTKEKLLAENDPSTSLLDKSAAEHYVTRHTWELPSEAALLKWHPLTDEPFWQLILRKVGVPVSDSAVFSQERPRVDRHWQEFLDRMSWWELKRYFNRQGKSLVLKPQADVVVVHPVGRFTQARTDAEWKDACYWTLLAHCNHGGDVSERVQRCRASEYVLIRSHGGVNGTLCARFFGGAREFTTGAMPTAYSKGLALRHGPEEGGSRAAALSEPSCQFACHYNV